MILEGEGAVLKNRELMGATDPKKAEKNTIRNFFGISIDKKLCSRIRLFRECKKRNKFFFKD